MQDKVIFPDPFTRLKAGHLLCRVDEIDNPGCKEFIFEGSKDTVSIFLVRQHDAVRAYVNQCPHAGARLNFKPHDFLTSDKQQIICGHHGAVFEIDDGACTGGPCTNFALQSVPIKVEQGLIYTASAT